MSLFDVHSDATAGLVDALIAAEAMRTITLLMSELHTASCCEETYSSAGLSSIARASFGVPLWLRRINLGLEIGEEGSSPPGVTASGATEQALRNAPGRSESRCPCWPKPVPAWPARLAALMTSPTKVFGFAGPRPLSRMQDGLDDLRCL